MENGRPGDDQPMELCANEAVLNTPPRSENATWNFVQMNMTLLPIARPLPVSVSHRFQEGAALAGIKPCTPTQKLHHRLRQHSSNISPRRHDLDGPVLRPATTTSPVSSHGKGLPPTPRTACGSKRKLPDSWHVPAIDTTVPPPAVSAALRVRSFSEDHMLHQSAQRRDSGYSSDPAMNGRQAPTDHSPLHRSASLSSGCAGKAFYKGKRILELQDEERRLHPDDRVTAPSPSKRSKQS